MNKVGTPDFTYILLNFIRSFHLSFLLPLTKLLFSTLVAIQLSFSQEKLLSFCYSFVQKTFLFPHVFCFFPLSWTTCFFFLHCPCAQSNFFFLSSSLFCIGQPTHPHLRLNMNTWKSQGFHTTHTPIFTHPQILCVHTQKIGDENLGWQFHWGSTTYRFIYLFRPITWKCKNKIKVSW